MDERRKFQRRHVVFYSRVYNRSTGELVGHLMDISPDGLKLISEQPIPIHLDFHFRMDLPEDVMEKDYMFFSAESVWCTPDVNPDFYNTGFKVLAMPPEDIELLSQMIEDVGWRE